MRLVDTLAGLLVKHDGPLTSSLARTPGGFGLGQVPARLRPDATARTVCGFCSTGCSLTVHLKDGQPVNVSPTSSYPVNQGMACPKGWEALAPLTATDRATTPLLRERGGKATPVSWDTALRTFVTRMKAVQARHGAHAISFLSSGQIVTEEMALLGAMAKFGMGMLHCDSNTRQCMATSAVAYKQSFGYDAPPYAYADLEASDVLVFVGANPCIAHPIMWQRVCKNPHEPEIIVVDPRTTETAMAATAHLALRPKSDLALLYGLAHILCARGWVDEAFVAAHTSGIEGFRAHVAAFTPARVAGETGIPAERLEAIAALIHGGKRVSFWWTMGVNQSHEGVRVAQAIIDLALLTGNIGRPGTGANSITGQCNAMGSRLYSNTTNLIGGHDFADPAHRAKVAGVLGISQDVIPTAPGLAYDQIVEGILAGKIKGLWVIGTNPAHSWINQRDFHEVLGKLDFLVVQDMYASTETAQLADLVLPAAGWGEKDGTFINSERRVGLTRKVARAPGQALADFGIFRAIAEYWGLGDMFAAWSSPEAVFGILRELSRGQPSDISGISGYQMLDEHGGVQWPLPEGTDVASLAAERRLFEDGRFFHTDGKARFVYEAPRPLPEPTSANYPFVLLTGRGQSSQWHTQTRTKKSAILRRLSPLSIYVELNPVDARRLGVRPRQWVWVQSQRGRVKARAVVTPTVPTGQVFVPMHYAKTNVLTFPAFDPYSRQPSYKHCAVNVVVADE